MVDSPFMSVRALLLGLVLATACRSVQGAATGPDAASADGAATATTADGSGGDGTGAPSSSDGMGSALPAGDVFNAQATAGTRLRPRAWQAMGGPALFDGFWQDTTLGHLCAFKAGADGQLYCVPAGAIEMVSAGLFADAGCSEALYAQAPRNSTSGDIDFAYRETRDSCPTRFAFYRGRGRFTGQPFRRDATGCQPQDPTVVPQELFRLAEDATALATATVEAGRGSGALTPLFLAGADGSRGFWGWQDDRGHRCRFDVNVAGGRAFCRPDDTGWISACTPDVAEAPGGCEGGIPLATKGDSCTQQVTVHQIGVRNETFRDCSLSSDRSHFAVGAETVPPAPLLAAAPAPSAGGRIRLRAARTATGAEALTFWDATTGEDCIPQTSAGLVMRCLPRAYWITEVGFADPACTQPLALLYGSTPFCATRHFASVVEQTSIVVAVYRLGAPSGGPYYQKNGDGSCSAGNGTLIPYQVTGMMVPTDFVETPQVVLGRP